MECFVFVATIYVWVTAGFYTYLEVFEGDEEIGVSKRALALLWPVFVITAFVEVFQGLSAYFINKNR
jgi:hypothetical protein